MIDRTGRWWRGEAFGDLAEYLRTLTAEGYPADRILPSVCSCGGRAHRLRADALEGVAQRTCARCGSSAFIADSEENWAEARPERWRCVCGTILRARGRLLPQEYWGCSLDHRGAALHTLWGAGAMVDWKVSHGPSAHLLTQV